MVINRQLQYLLILCVCIGVTLLVAAQTRRKPIETSVFYHRSRSLNQQNDVGTSEQTLFDFGDKTIVIGMGTGRSGTDSLAALLNSQPSAHVSHEHHDQGCGKDLLWHPSTEGLNYTIPSELRTQRARLQLDRFRRELNLKRELTLFGDVSFYHLPYAEIYLKSSPNVKVVVLKRDRNETAASWERWLAPFKSFPWSIELGKEHKPHEKWDLCFPKYYQSSQNLSVYEGASRYWDDYYSHAELLKTQFPDRVHIYDFKQLLNKKETAEDMLSWLGMKNKQFKNLGEVKNRSWGMQKPQPPWLLLCFLFSLRFLFSWA